MVTKEIAALRVNQWMPAWSAVKWDKNEHRAEPQHCFYLFNIGAGYLKALSGIYPRSTKDRTRGVEDLGIQRRHEKDRSDEIARFIQYGYPWSTLSNKKRQDPEFHNLRKPGWLPTAIVLNILVARDRRLDKVVDEHDLIEVREGKNGLVKIALPDNFGGRSWRPRKLPPIEIIDGQHRLWAFEEGGLPDDFELPVVAFKGLDISWQAYLFYTINIKPKKINASLAFDLYPLLRTEDWLDKFEEHVIYRQTRAQELVDVLWSHGRSPWHKRINMLGEPGQRGRMVSQAAWIHSLLATVMRGSEGRGRELGGLFGAPIGKDRQTLPWNRAEQAAFLIFLGNHLREAIKESSSPWAKSLRSQGRPAGLAPTADLAFFGPDSLLNQDQGIRAFLYVLNDFLFVQADELELATLGGAGVSGTEEDGVDEALRKMQHHKPLGNFVEKTTKALVTYDWRSSDASELSPEESLLKAAFRGSGGYRQLRLHVLKHLAEKTGDIGRLAKATLKIVGE